MPQLLELYFFSNVLGIISLLAMEQPPNTPIFVNGASGHYRGQSPLHTDFIIAFVKRLRFLFIISRNISLLNFDIIPSAFI